MVFNYEETAVKAVGDGEAYDAAKAEEIGLAFTYAMITFAHHATNYQAVFKEEGIWEEWKAQGWKLKHRGSDNRNLGAGNVAVRSFEFEYPAHGLSYYFDVANIKGYNIIITWIQREGEDTEINFKVTRLIPQ